MPERGFIKVCIRKNLFEARYDVSGSSFRINLGRTYACLLKHEIDYGISKIKGVFKLDGCFMMFYREDDETPYQPTMNRPDYKRGFYYCSRCNISFKDKEVCPYCGIKTRKKGRKNGNGEKPRINPDFGVE